MIAGMRKLLATAAAALVFAACSAANVDHGSTAAIKGPSAHAYAYVVVSISDMQQALALWVDRFGMEIARRREGKDPGLARVWGLPDDAIVDQALLNTPGMIDGGVHLVRFARPGDTVREGAGPTDLVSKSIVIAVRYIAARHAQLAAAGHPIVSKVATLQINGETVYEASIPAHDGLDLVIRELPEKPETVSPKGYGAAARMIAVTSDNEREAAFLRNVLGLDLLEQYRVAGTEAEFDVSVVGARDSRFGRLELVHYVGAEGRDLYPRAVPPARGLISVTYVVSDIAPILARGRAAGIADHGSVQSILGEGPMASVTSPAGLRIDVIQL